jgi:hypothetical protein
MEGDMTRASRHNLHLPLPDDLHEELRDEAARRGQPATTVARTAIAEWLKERHRLQVREEIANYAAGQAGSKCDLDSELAAAAVDLLGRDEG